MKSESFFKQKNSQHTNYVVFLESFLNQNLQEIKTRDFDL